MTTWETRGLNVGYAKSRQITASMHPPVAAGAFTDKIAWRTG